MAKAQRFIPILASGVLAASLLLSPGCSTGVAPSKTASGAKTGAIAGAVGGAVIGNQSNSAGQGAVVGGLAGAVVGGVVGMVQEARERSEQDRVAQERLYQQELAKRRAQEAKFKAAIEEELAVAEGFRISEQEIAQVESKAKQREAELKALQEERQAALNRKRSLDSAQARIAAAESEIQRLEAELAELRGENRPAASPALEHRVEEGEDIESIAAHYKVSAAAIREANSGVDVDRLVPGQKLRIPVSGASASSKPSE